MLSLKCSWISAGVSLYLILLLVGFFHFQARGEEGHANPLRGYDGAWAEGGNNSDLPVKLARAQEPAESSSEKEPPEIKLGMTPDEVKEAWGEPNEVKKTQTCWGEFTVWIYRDREDLGIKGEKKLTFEENQLTEIE